MSLDNIDVEEYLLTYSLSLGGYIEDLPTRFYDSTSRSIISSNLPIYLDNAIKYYNRNYGYNPDVISNLRLLITRLHDTIQRSKDKGDLKMQKFLEDAEAQLEKILNNLIGKYGNPSKTQDEVNYEKRYQKYYYKYPYPRTKNTKTGLSLEEEVKEQILQIMKDGESHKSQGYIDNIIPEEQMIYTLEQLSKIREEYRKRNAELEANRKAKEEKEEKALSLSMDSSKTPLLDRIRKSGKIIMKEA